MLFGTAKSHCLPNTCGATAPESNTDSYASPPPPARFSSTSMVRAQAYEKGDKHALREICPSVPSKGRSQMLTPTWTESQSP